MRLERSVYCFMALAGAIYVNAAGVIPRLHYVLGHFENFSL